MNHVLKAVIIADAHIGADKFDTHPDRWDAPVREAFNWAIDNGANLVLSAGDFMHKRNPTVAEHLRRQDLLEILDAAGVPYLEVDGNHDRPNAAGSHSALEIAQQPTTPPLQGQAHSIMYGGVNIVGLPWPRLDDYLVPGEVKNMSIDEKIGITRTMILNRLTDMVRMPTETPLIMFGHAMLAYGPVGKATEELAQDPGLILGKDVVLPYQTFIDAGLTENQIMMGHVHDPASLGYVGSTQPTDWGEAGQDKSFVELDISRDGEGWAYDVTRHSYKDQLRLHDIVLEEIAEDSPYLQILGDRLLPEIVDVARVTVDLEGSATVNEAAIREFIEGNTFYRRLDRVIINHPKREAARVDTGKIALVDMGADEAFEVWMKQAGYTADEAIAPHSIFQELVEASK